MAPNRKSKIVTQRWSRGFTLIELLVVILILSMLAGFAAPPIFKRLGKAKADLAKPRMAVIENALKQYELDCGQLPDDAEGGLEALLMSPPELEEKWAGPYLKQSQLLDPWGNPYLYVREGQYNPGSFDLISFGADGAEGGEGENADIAND
ncbi:MAG: type II secretion system major pseudopilin GspG [Planctomycetes bacterium]|nr:type II secretion system major pseudopilin GspG [Planctomycetota bacterium]